MEDPAAPPSGFRRKAAWRRLTAGALAIGAAVPALTGCASSAPSPSDSSPAALASSLYVDPHSEAARWVESHPGDPAARTIGSRIADEPTGKWFGAWSGDITSAVAKYTSGAAEAGKVPVLVAYNIPGRDCGGQSAGGLKDDSGYRRWIDGFAAGLGDHPAVVILEPDALAQLTSCLDLDQQHDRLRLLSYAVSTLQRDDVSVYLDAGHSKWVPAEDMAARLVGAGIGQADGFALNVSNYNPTDDEVAYARELNRTLGMSKPFVVDTSRNGKGSNGDWCNPAGRQIGESPGAGSGGELRLWLKAPGESDGNCGIAEGTAAGEFSPELAMSLITGEDTPAK